MPPGKVLFSVLTVCFVMMIVLPAYSAKLVKEEEIRKPETAEGLRSTTDQRSVKPVEEEKIKKPRAAKRPRLTAKQKLENNKQQVTQETPRIEIKEQVEKPLKSENEKVPQVSAISGSTFWWWLVAIAVAVTVVMIIKAFIASQDKKYLELVRQEKEREQEREERRKYLVEKYGEKEGLELFEHKFWVGMTVEQLIDSIGEPYEKNDISHEQTYFYDRSQGPGGGIRYGITITIKDGEVTNVAFQRKVDRLRNKTRDGFRF